MIEPFGDAQPQHAGRASFRKKPKSVEHQIERGLRDRTPECIEQETFDAGVRVGYEMQRQVHLAPAYPSGAAQLLNCRFLLQGPR